MFKDNQTENTSVEGRRKNRRKNKFEIEGLFRESETSEEENQ